MDKLNLLKIFLAVVDQGSFANAAVALALTPSAVSKAMARLEDELQLQLIYRTTRKVTLTDVGLRYAAKARDILLDLELCETALRHDNREPEGCLKVNLPVSYGRQYVLPLMEEFYRLYPKIQVQLSFDDGYVDMIEHGIDVTIRSGTLDDSSLVARQLSPIDYLICASPDYIERHGPILAEHYSQHPWVRFRFKQSGRLNPVMLTQGKKLLYMDPGQQFIVDDGEASATLCAQGLGLAQLPHFLARHWLREKQLQVLAPRTRPKGHGVWLVYAKREFLPAKIEHFVSFIERHVRAQGETPRQTWADDY